MPASLPIQISRDGNRPSSKLATGLLALAVMSMATGCASRPYPKNNGGEGNSLFAAMILPFVIANEVALFAIEKKKENAADVVAAKKLSLVRRFDELHGSVSSGDAATQYELGFCYLHARGATYDAAQAAFWFRKSAEQGFAEAQNDLGLCYYNEIGVRRDDIEACAWWSLAAPTHVQAAASLVYVESNTEKRLTTEAFAAFRASVRRRAEEIKKLF
jgi:TPR repeat protein